jgi:hypothetical protein
LFAEKLFTKKNRVGRVAQSEGPEFKPQYRKMKKKPKKTKNKVPGE